jgi:flavin-dependent dehydrogenase
VVKETAPAYIVDRPVFDLTLAKKAQEQGAEYLLGTQVRDIAVEKDFVQLEVSGENLIGKAAVIASGFGSNLGQKLKLGRVADFAIGAQAEVVAINRTNEVEIYLGSKFAPGFFAWLVPTSQGKALAGLLSRHHPGLYLKSFLSYLSKQGKIDASTARISYGGIPLRPLPKTYRERIIVVGDAAGQTKPTTGGGIYYDLLCAQIAADVLHQALWANDFSSKTFVCYEKGWHDKLSTELMIDYWARRSFERLSDGQIEKIFHLICSNGIYENLLNAKDFSFDWHSRLILNGLRYIIPCGVLQILRAPFKGR